MSNTKIDIKLPDNLKRILVTDCGSTTTKALLFENTGSGWEKVFRGEAPTTVEDPVADVTVGALNAFIEIEEMSHIQLLKDRDNSSNASPFLTPYKNVSAGIDLYLSTSSAGGGLQMVVAGAVKNMTTESAERAALGAGAIILDALSADELREEHEKIKRVRHLKPDIVLITGGVDGGSISHVLEAAEIIVAANPKPRFGITLKLPVIYAGNSDAAAEVKKLLADYAEVTVVENVRPTLTSENLKPAREAIHELFLSHVMSHSPGYDKLLGWTQVPILPTPTAVGLVVESYAKKKDIQLLCVDIGGATTDVFSVCRNREGKFIYNRTVSANLGMSYSIANVLLEAGAACIKRWLPYRLTDTELIDRLRNKMIRPTTIPQTIEDLYLEQAVCREALRLSLLHHKSLAVGLSGQRQGTASIADIFNQKQNRYELLSMKSLDMVVGSGGVLSHAPERLQAALMMLDGFELEGVTEVTVDSIFMMPHLGVLSTVEEGAASELFENDCIVYIALSVVPVWKGSVELEGLVDVLVNHENATQVFREKVTVYSLNQYEEYIITLRPRHKAVDVGKGPGISHSFQYISRGLGLLLDGRNRPLIKSFTRSEDEQAVYQKSIYESLGLRLDFRFCIAE
jgi:uncharacterized protein (TIGR01319 family)